MPQPQIPSFRQHKLRVKTRAIFDVSAGFELENLAPIVKLFLEGGPVEEQCYRGRVGDAADGVGDEFANGAGAEDVDTGRDVDVCVDVLGAGLHLDGRCVQYFRVWGGMS